jgi:hypothetical protein
MSRWTAICCFAEKWQHTLGNESRLNRCCSGPQCVSVQCSAPLPIPFLILDYEVKEQLWGKTSQQPIHAFYEPASACQRARDGKQLAPQVTAAERLLITWLSGVREDNYVEAIAAMNDLVDRVPKGQTCSVVGGSWLLRRNGRSVADR